VPPVRVDLHWEHGRLVAVATTSADVAAMARA
jgi:hypothetical protein